MVGAIGHEVFGDDVVVGGADSCPLDRGSSHPLGEYFSGSC